MSNNFPSNAVFGNAMKTASHAVTSGSGTLPDGVLASIQPLMEALTSAMLEQQALLKAGQYKDALKHQAVLSNLTAHYTDVLKPVLQDESVDKRLLAIKLADAQKALSSAGDTLASAVIGTKAASERVVKLIIDSARKTAQKEASVGYGGIVRDAAAKNRPNTEVLNIAFNKMC